MTITRAPYIIPWAGEITLPEPLMITPGGVFYVDPRVDQRHRDDDSVLWEACGGQQTGPRIYALLHPGRQPEAMRYLLCATCGGPASRNADGMLWLMPLLAGPPAEGTTWEGVQTNIPPSCEPCADKATKGCPWLRGGHARLRVREAEQIGVRGTLYPRPGQPGPAQDDALVLYDSPDTQYVVARHAVRELSRVFVEAVFTTTLTPSGTACPYAGVAFADRVSA
ncbi:hypothetical protein SAMN05216483_6771 [Streptomyces sp. 2131.1]|uniref:hypothetical protein n=1 Tax=Streptomyces sp. 2131.1 TaxID=1855346 RepID=UPI00089D6191|nr:hypothetical protein [Streptomyces sp. 2131.1]SEE84747.1 hypothetical protein SAMN05216483_6771 [Streptomyces sp. 2131.1]